MTATSPGRTCRALIMAALSQEVRPFLRRVKAEPRRDLGLTAWDWEGGAVILALSGMGATAARRAAEILISRCKPEVLVSLGFAGALVPGLAAGDVVLGEAFWDYDPVTRELRQRPQPLVPQPLARLCTACKNVGLSVVCASLVTTTRIIHKKDQGTPLAALPQPVLDLETAALAAVAAGGGLPFVSLRAITDTAAEEIPEFLREAGGPKAIVGIQDALAWMGGDVRRVRDLVKLWRACRRAARSLAEALAILMPLLLAARGDLEDQPGQKGDIDEDSHPA